MSYENSVEATGESVEEAIAKGLEELGARPGEVIVEVLDEPIPTAFGLEGRPARVRLQKITVKKSSESVSSVSASPISRPYVESTPIVIPQSPASYDELPSYMDIDIDDGENASVPFLSDTDDVAEADFDEEVAIGKVVLGELLEKLGIRGKVCAPWRPERQRPVDPGPDWRQFLTPRGQAGRYAGCAAVYHAPDHQPRASAPL
jgi:predicted RNA-binding protein Jag